MEKDVSTHSKTQIKPEEYLELERKAETKSEYLDGEMFVMAGVTREHNRIVLNLATALNSQFRDRPCEVFATDLRTKVASTGLYTYPDVIALCGEPQFEDEHFDTLLNPQVIVEVLSESTESYDRGRKFAHYRAIDSLREYILVAQTECRVERFSRRDDGDWLYNELTDPHTSIEITSVACRVSLSDIYARVHFERVQEE